MKYLNLGCGVRFHKDWINADMCPSDVSVMKCNFLNGIPFEDNFFDVVYHSHVLEHFPQKAANYFISECYRILKPGGVLRVVTPNLERITQEYLHNLQKAIDGSTEAEQDYDWILLELYDQTVREKTGGEMADYLRGEIKNFAYVSKRIGNPFINNSHTNSEDLKSKSNVQRRNRLKSIANRIKKKAVSLILGANDAKALEVGRFRASGEIHQWLYDRFSLPRLLKKNGFKKIAVVNAKESFIPDWEKFNLDNPEETASIFVEGIK